MPTFMRDAHVCAWVPNVGVGMNRRMGVVKAPAGRGLVSNMSHGARSTSAALSLSCRSHASAGRGWCGGCRARPGGALPLGRGRPRPCLTGARAGPVVGASGSAGVTWSATRTRRGWDDRGLRLWGFEPRWRHPFSLAPGLGARRPQSGPRRCASCSVLRSGQHRTWGTASKCPGSDGRLPAGRQVGAKWAGHGGAVAPALPWSASATIAFEPGTEEAGHGGR